MGNVNVVERRNEAGQIGRCAIAGENVVDNNSGQILATLPPELINYALASAVLDLANQLTERRVSEGDVRLSEEDAKEKCDTPSGKPERCNHCNEMCEDITIKGLCISCAAAYDC